MTKDSQFTVQQSNAPNQSITDPSKHSVCSSEYTQSIGGGMYNSQRENDRRTNLHHVTMNIGNGRQQTLSDFSFPPLMITFVNKERLLH